MKIPKQLENKKFCKLAFKGKKPIEKGWQNKPYTIKSIQPHLDTGANYGVITGINGLGVLDDDTPDKQLIKIYEENFPNTFRVRDHFYITLKEWDGKKIIFYDENGKHLGELQGKGQQAVGPNCTHPSGDKYDIRNDIPIVEIEYENFEKVFSKYIKKKTSKVIKEHKQINWSGDNITDIPISSIVSFVGLHDVGKGCFQGCHPSHGSTGGMNFRVDTVNNQWYCFRCSAGGGPSELIAVVEGIIDCSAAGSSCYNETQAQEVIKIAREKYGLKTPMANIEDMQPQGWALSINIKSMAEKRDMGNCPVCTHNLSFNERLGFFDCPSCKLRGGIKKLIKLNIGKREVTQNGNR